MQSCSSRCLPAFRSGRWDIYMSGRSRRHDDDCPRAGTGIQALLSSPDLTLPAHGLHYHHHYRKPHYHHCQERGLPPACGLGWSSCLCLNISMRFNSSILAKFKFSIFTKFQSINFIPQKQDHMRYFPVEMFKL